MENITNFIDSTKTQAYSIIYAIAGAVLGLTVLIVILYGVWIALTYAKSSDANKRKEHLKKLGFIVLGFVIAACIFAVSGLITQLIMGSYQSAIQKSDS
ncbi:Mbov_0395 family pilin-like conjugal transfer protein [Mycoplasma sp. 1573]